MSSYALVHLRYSTWYSLV
uniref:Uncharacterized protein n=1 Tax=Anguilla anguilla TaxID=7936 RepID=A0A0E9XVJ5_ANGAN